MLEFHFKFNRKDFTKKGKQLLEEIKLLLSTDNVNVLEAPTPNIPFEYKQLLGEPIYKDLNNLYYTLRAGANQGNLLYKKYLPEYKTPPANHLLFADFFSGAGGLGQGLVNAGFEPTFVNDCYTNAIETYYFNHTLPLAHFSNNDIRALDTSIQSYEPYLKGVKVITGGPPCQGFSTANRRNYEIDASNNNKRFIDDPRNILYKHFIKMLGFIKPDFFIIENVRGMMKVEKQVEEDIKKASHEEYFFIPLVLDAQWFDIPQSRVRYFLIGGRDFMFIEQVKENLKLKKKKTSKYKLEDALYGLPPISTNPHKLKVNFESEINGYTIRNYRCDQNPFLKEINKGKESKYLFNHKARYNNQNDLEIFKLLPEGENSLHSSISHLNKYKNRNHIFLDKYYKLKRSEVSKTITSHMKFDCHMYIHPFQHRGLSPREAARIQTFPDEYVFRGTSLNDWYKQIGNAVPVKLAELIGNELRRYYK